MQLTTYLNTKSKFCTSIFILVELNNKRYLIVSILIYHHFSRMQMSHEQQGSLMMDKTNYLLMFFVPFFCILIASLVLLIFYYLVRRQRLNEDCAVQPDESNYNSDAAFVTYCSEYNAVTQSHITTTHV